MDRWPPFMRALRCPELPARPTEGFIPKANRGPGGGCRQAKGDSRRRFQRSNPRLSQRSILCHSRPLRLVIRASNRFKRHKRKRKRSRRPPHKLRLRSSSFIPVRRKTRQHSHSRHSRRGLSCRRQYRRSSRHSTWSLCSRRSYHSSSYCSRWWLPTRRPRRRSGWWRRRALLLRSLTTGSRLGPTSCPWRTILSGRPPTRKWCRR